MQHCALVIWVTVKLFSLLVPPAFVKKIENVSTVLGDVAVFCCVVEGSLPLYVQWQKDESWIPEDPLIERKFENKQATLRIPACDVTHSGKYTCQVVNEAGQDKCFASLTVQGTCASCMIPLPNKKPAITAIAGALTSFS